MKRVPWTGFDVFLFLAIWLAPLFVSIATASIVSLKPPHVEATAGDATVSEATASDVQDHGHPIAQLIAQSEHSLAILLLAFFAGVVVASIVEEFLFRMLFQGWLEATFRQHHVPYGSGMAIVIVALCFSAIHISNNDAVDVATLKNGFIVSSVYSLMVFTAGVIYLTQVRNVRIADYFIGTEKFFRPGFFMGAGCCLLVMVFCFELFVVLKTIYPNTNVAPIPLFFFALALGVLYSRTQNLSYCMLLHACLNGTSLMLVWFGMG